MRPIKRSLTIAGHRTSISLEPPFWLALKEVAAAEGVTVTGLVARIDAEGSSAADASGLSSRVRIHILRHFRGRNP